MLTTLVADRDRHDFTVIPRRINLLFRVVYRVVYHLGPFHIPNGYRNFRRTYVT